MCGLGGFFALDSSSRSITGLNLMSSALAHRGPDDSGVWERDNIKFFHRRLKILDTSNQAAQPMISPDKRFVLLYNGEIYNFAQIRKELTNIGVEIKSTGDTEVLLHALIQWGTKAISKLNGMFAFAFFDSFENRLVLARDRYGIKPLYYFFDGRTFVFASEEKAVKAHPTVPVELDLYALVEYFTFQNIFTNRTFYRGIQSLDPATYMEVCLNNQSIKTKVFQYWDFQFTSPNDSANLIEQTEEIERLFSQAVQRCLISDVPMGQYLSGGIDTSLIATETSAIVKGIPTFTVGFSDSGLTGLELGFDEREEARLLSEFLHTDHEEYVLQAGDMQSCLSELSGALDTPRVGQSYPNFFAAKMASGRVKVVLSGTGSDEIFAGYPWRYLPATQTSSSEEFIDFYYAFWQRLVPEQLKPELFKPIYNSILGYDTKDVFRQILLSHNSETEGKFRNLNDSLYLESKTFLPGLLNIEDKIHMHFGIENRVPFLDNDLVDFALRCDPLLKISQPLKSDNRVNENLVGNKKGRLNPSESGKQVLRNIYRKRLPSFQGWQFKKGFSAPDSSWFRGPNLNWLRTQLLDSSHSMYAYLDFQTVSILLEEHFSAKQNRRLFIWSLLSLKSWLDNNK